MGQFGCAVLSCKTRERSQRGIQINVRYRLVTLASGDYNVTSVNSGWSMTTSCGGSIVKSDKLITDGEVR